MEHTVPPGDGERSEPATRWHGRGVKFLGADDILCVHEMCFLMVLGEWVHLGNTFYKKSEGLLRDFPLTYCMY